MKYVEVDSLGKCIKNKVYPEAVSTLEASDVAALSLCRVAV